MMTDKFGKKVVRDDLVLLDGSFIGRVITDVSYSWNGQRSEKYVMVKTVDTSHNYAVYSEEIERLPKQANKLKQRLTLLTLEGCKIK